MIRALTRRYPRWSRAFWAGFIAYQIAGLWVAYTEFPAMVAFAQELLR